MPYPASWRSDITPVTKGPSCRGGKDNSVQTLIWGSNGCLFSDCCCHFPYFPSISPINLEYSFRRCRLWMEATDCARWDGPNCGNRMQISHSNQNKCYPLKTPGDSVLSVKIYQQCTPLSSIHNGRYTNSYIVSADFNVLLPTPSVGRA